jgi:uncharacterized RDD family membrane protein YckC
MTTSSSAGQLDFTHWIIRLVAYIIDSIIIAIPAAIIYFIILAAAVLGSPFFVFYGGWLVFPFLFGILEVLYFIILDVSWGATIGKRLMGLQVQTVNGARINFGQSIIRNISKIYWLFLVLDWLIGVATTGPDRRQKWTDRLAGTTVVQVGRAPIGSTEPPPSYTPPPPPPPA